MVCKSAIALGNSKEGKNSDYMDWFSGRNKQKGKMSFQVLKFIIFFIFKFFFGRVSLLDNLCSGVNVFYKKISFTTWLDKL